MDPELFDPKPAADFIGSTVGTMAVWRCKKRYPLRYVKVGSRVKYRRSDLLEFLAARTVSGDGSESKRTRRHRTRRAA